MKKNYALLFVFVFIVWNMHAQKHSTFPDDPGTPFDPYFVETLDTVSPHGPHTITRNVLQDKKGNYWLTTWQGLMRYDGKMFTNVTLKDGLLHFHVNALLEDKAGNIWFGAARAGVYRYDPSASHKTGEKPFRLFTTKDGLVDNNLLCMLEDNAGNIWFGTDSGATRYDGKNFTRFKKKDGFSDSYVNCMMQDRNGKIWFGTVDGLYIFNGSSFTELKNKSGMPITRVWSLLQEKDGSVLMGGANGLCRYDPSGGFTDLKQEVVSSMYLDRSGNIWLSASEINPESKMQIRKYYQVLYRYDGTSFTKIIGKNYSDDSQVFGITQDKAGDIWFGTMKGICRYDGRSVAAFTN